MRLVASIALIFLLLLGALELQRRAGEQRSTGQLAEARTAPLELHVFSAGRGHDAPAYGARDVAHGILVGSRMFEPAEPATAGLCVLAIEPGGNAGELQTFSVGESAAELTRLDDLLERPPNNTVFLFSLASTIRPAREELRGPLREFFRRIGARTDPSEIEFCSFAYLSVRRGGRFQPLAESYSPVTGVHLSFLLESDPGNFDSYDGRDVPALIDERKRFYLPITMVEGEGLRVSNRLTLRSRRLLGLTTMLGTKQDRHASWRLGSDADGPLVADAVLGFEALIGLRPRDPLLRTTTELGGVRFQLLLDGVAHSSVTLFDHAALERGWERWSAELDPDLRTVDRVELRMTRIGEPESLPVQVFLVEPRMIVGSTHSL